MNRSPPMSRLREHMGECFRRMFFMACRDGDLKSAKMTLKILNLLNHPPTRRSFMHPSAFYLACISGNLGLVEYLYSKKIHLLDSRWPMEDGPGEPDFDGDTTFAESIANTIGSRFNNPGEEEDALVLYSGRVPDEHAYNSANSFYAVCCLGYIHIFDFLVEKIPEDEDSKNIMLQRSLEVACSSKNTPNMLFIKYLIEVLKIDPHRVFCAERYEHGSSVFQKVVLYGSLELVRYFVEKLGFSKDFYEPCRECGRVMEQMPILDAVKSDEKLKYLAPKTFTYFPVAPNNFTYEQRNEWDIKKLKAICKSNVTHVCVDAEHDYPVCAIEECADFIKKSCLVMFFDFDHEIYCVGEGENPIIHASIAWRRSVYYAGPHWTPFGHHKFPREIRGAIQTLLLIYHCRSSRTSTGASALQSFRAMNWWPLFTMVFAEIGRLNYYEIEPTWVDFLA